MFKKQSFVLNLAKGASSPVVSPGIMLDPAQYQTFQFQFNLASSTNTELTLEQSADGANFDTVKDNAGDPVMIELDKDNTSATLNVADLVTVWFRFSVVFPGDETGSISGVTILSK